MCLSAQESPHGSCRGLAPLGGPAAYLALAMHSKVISLDPATTLLLPGGITMMGATVSGMPTSPVAEKAEGRGPLLSREDVDTGHNE